jgi:acyl-coenzyme A synthetase/AMP-(fatty) acid ligase
VVVANDGVTGDDELRATLASHCRDNLAGFKVPRSIDFVAELPRTGTGKIQKAKLRAPYWEGHDRQI